MSIEAIPTKEIATPNIFLVNSKTECPHVAKCACYFSGLDDDNLKVYYRILYCDSQEDTKNQCKRYHLFHP